MINSRLIKCTFLLFALVLSACSSTGPYGPPSTPRATLEEGYNRIYFTRTNQLSGHWKQPDISQDTRASRRSTDLATMVLVAATIASGGYISTSIGLNTVYEPRPQARYSEFLVDVFSADDDLTPLLTLSNNSQPRYLDTDLSDAKFVIDTYSSGLFTRRYDGNMQQQTIAFEDGFSYVMLASRHQTPETNSHHWDLQPIKVAQPEVQYCEELAQTDLSKHLRNRKIESYSHKFYGENGEPGQAYLFVLACDAIATAQPISSKSLKALNKRFAKHSSSLTAQIDEIITHSLTGRPAIILQNNTQ